MDDLLLGIEDQPVVQETHCGNCGRRIIPDNDSGWHCFVTGGVAPQCSDCYKKADTITEKAETIE